MMRKLTSEDFAGKRFGMLIAKRMFRDDKAPKVECICDCGATKIVNSRDLRSGGSKSCGCLRSITFNKIFTKHGHARKNGKPTKEYRAWRGMVSRCNGNFSRKYYIEKGIKVSADWVDNFPAFLNHIGPAPTSRHTVDRIDNNLGYQPGNVRWATSKEQARNRSNGVYVTVDGERMLLVEAAERHSINARIVRARLVDGWSDEAAIKTPVQLQNSHPPQLSASRPLRRHGERLR